MFAFVLVFLCLLVFSVLAACWDLIQYTVWDLACNFVRGIASRIHREFIFRLGQISPALRFAAEHPATVWGIARAWFFRSFFRAKGSKKNKKPKSHRRCHVDLAQSRRREGGGGGDDDELIILEAFVVDGTTDAIMLFDEHEEPDVARITAAQAAEFLEAHGIETRGVWVVFYEVKGQRYTKALGYPALKLASIASTPAASSILELLTMETHNVPIPTNRGISADLSGFPDDNDIGNDAFFDDLSPSFAEFKETALSFLGPTGEIGTDFLSQSSDDIVTALRALHAKVFRKLEAKLKVKPDTDVHKNKNKNKNKNPNQNNDPGFSLALTLSGTTKDHIMPIYL